MKKIAIVALLSAFVAAPAVAADMYAGVNVGQNKYDDSTLGVTFSGNKTGLTFGLGGQFNVTPAVGIRAGFDRYKTRVRRKP